MRTVNFFAVIHKSYPKHPRILTTIKEGESTKNLLVWPCSGEEHPLHTSITFIPENYTSVTPMDHSILSNETIDSALVKACNTNDKDQALSDLMQHRNIITGLCKQIPHASLFPQQ